jgi:hypothetical protein
VQGVEASVTRAVREPVAADGPTEPLHPRIAFEHSDIAARHVVIGGYCVLIGVLIVTSLLYFYFSFLAHDRAASSPPPLAIEAHGTPLPPRPRLQSSPRRDLQDMRVFENSVLNKYWWVDRTKGVVGLPIDRAMDLLLERGIPPQKAPADLKLFPPKAGDRSVGFEGKVAPEPR